MNYHYPKYRSQWQEKIERKRKLTNFLPDDRDKFNNRSKFINKNVHIINNSGFEQDQMMSNTIKGIKFEFVLVDTHDQSEELPFKFIIEKMKSRLEWNHDYENHLYINEKFIDLIKKYARMYYAIKILDTNMDNIKLQIKQLYPEFHNIVCKYRYKYTDDTDSESEQSETKENNTNIR